jgi:hypothetical protein
MVFNATFNNISVISWRSILLMEVPGENHIPAASHWQTLLHNVDSRPYTSYVTMKSSWYSKGMSSDLAGYESLFSRGSNVGACMFINQSCCSQSLHKMINYRAMFFPFVLPLLCGNLFLTCKLLDIFLLVNFFYLTILNNKKNSIWKTICLLLTNTLWEMWKLHQV